MNNNYKDITSRIAEPPTWWDENGVPRYGEFFPDMLPSIYAEQAVFYLIRCQCCDREFHVAEGLNIGVARTSFASQIEQKELHYCDPPSHGCIGDSMNSVPVKVISYWKKRLDTGWFRQTMYDGADLVPDWAKKEMGE